MDFDAEIFLDELNLIPGSVEHDAVPLIVDTNGYVLRRVINASTELKVLGKCRRLDADLEPQIEDDVFTEGMWDEQGLEHMSDGNEACMPTRKILQHSMHLRSRLLRGQLWMTGLRMVEGSFRMVQKMKSGQVTTITCM